MSKWEKVDFSKSMRNYPKEPVMSVTKHCYNGGKNTYKVSFNVLATKLLADRFIDYEGKIFVDIVSANAGSKLGLVKGTTFECKYRYKRQMLEIASKKLVEYLFARYGNNPVFRLVPIEGGVLELEFIKEASDNG